MGVKVRRLIIPLFCAAELFVLMIALERPAHAYVDPGSGLLMFQVGGSMLAGLLFTLRGKLRRLFRLKASTNADPSLNDKITPAGTHASESDS
jgi:hypothetical protein